MSGDKDEGDFGPTMSIGDDEAVMTLEEGFDNIEVFSPAAAAWRAAMVGLVMSLLLLAFREMVM